MRTTIRTKSLLGAAAAIAMLAGLSGCASSGTTTPPAAAGSSSASPSEPASAAGSATGSGASGATSGPTDLVGVTFVATEVTGAHTIAPGSTISLTFESGTLAARAGCNNLFGSFTIEGDVLLAPQLASTMMACDEALMAQDAWLSAFLASSPTWTYADGILTLTNGTDTLAMTAAPAGAEALEATGWKLVGLIERTASANTTSAVDPGLTPWIRFDDGRVAVNTSCNTGSGTAEIGDSSITFGPIAISLRACLDPAGTEQEMLAVLQGTTPYTLGDDPAGALLTIMSEDGTTGLQFTADPAVGADAFASAQGSAPATASSTG